MLEVLKGQTACSISSPTLTFAKNTNPLLACRLVMTCTKVKL